jgi:hypothetical protein
MFELEREIGRFHDEELRELHTALWEAVRVDQLWAPSSRRIATRSFPDWRRQCQAVEAEMSRRGLPFDSLPFD